MAPIPLCVAGINCRTVSSVTRSPPLRAWSMRSTETGHQSTRDCERRSMAGPNRKASVVTQAFLAPRQSLRALSKAAALGSEHKVSTESTNRPMASAA